MHSTSLHVHFNEINLVKHDKNCFINNIVDTNVLEILKCYAICNQQHKRDGVCTHVNITQFFRNSIDFQCNMTIVLKYLNKCPHITTAIINGHYF